jgi:hypothetical protein
MCRAISLHKPARQNIGPLIFQIKINKSLFLINPSEIKVAIRGYYITRNLVTCSFLVQELIGWARKSDGKQEVAYTQVEVGRCEIGRSWRPQNRSVSSYTWMWVVRVQRPLCVMGKMSRSFIMHKPHSLLHYQWNILQQLRQFFR